MATKRPPRPAPTGLVPESALEDIKEILHVGDAHITSDETTERYGMKWPFETRIYTHINSDGTVDGELRISDIPADISIREALVVLTEGNPFKTFKGLWSSIGLRFEDVPWESMKEKYSRHRGLNQESTYYARTSQKAMNHQMVIAQRISQGMEEYGLPKATQIYIRFHWNKMNVKPPSRYDRKVKRK